LPEWPARLGHDGLDLIKRRIDFLREATTDFTGLTGLGFHLDKNAVLQLN